MSPATKRTIAKPTLRQTATKITEGSARCVDCSHATGVMPSSWVSPPTSPMLGSSRNFQTSPIETSETIVGKKNTDRMMRVIRVSLSRRSATMKPMTTTIATVEIVKISVTPRAFQKRGSWKSSM